jgi:hypothetical protein
VNRQNNKTPWLVVLGSALCFRPGSLTPSAERRRAGCGRFVLRRVSQVVLDELAGRAQVHELKNPLGYLRKLISLAKSGNFQPELADKVREHRETRARNLAVLRRHEEAPRKPGLPINLDHLPQRLRDILLRKVRLAAQPAVERDDREAGHS